MVSKVVSVVDILQTTGNEESRSSSFNSEMTGQFARTIAIHTLWA